jgi:deoxyribodipyrimidine photolyase-related protein
MRGWEKALGLPVEIREDGRFLASRGEFRRWAHGRRSLTMEFFYREMRRKTGYLMDGDGEPAGGRWNFDAQNRKRLPKAYRSPEPVAFRHDATTRAVLDLVEERFGEHFGDLEPFDLAVTRTQALRALDLFVEHRLPAFGDYQDAMRQGAPFLNHSVLSPYINAGLLDPREVCERAIAAYEAGHAPLNAVEGFVRQIIGWREYVRGIYWLKMPDYAGTNALGATRPLPWFYWSGETEMNCLAQVIGETRANAYAHHIQRLMVTGLFALLAGLAPPEVEEWYLVVYADAYEWVELPNVHGMILHADGGLLATKPYAASGAYIDRMSDYCGTCRYDVKAKSGPDACPFNYLYWNFLSENRKALKGNRRLARIYAALDGMKDERRREIRRDARAFLERLDEGEAV